MGVTPRTGRTWLSTLLRHVSAVAALRVPVWQVSLVLVVFWLIAVNQRQALHEGTFLLSWQRHPLQHAYSIWLRLPRPQEDQLLAQIDSLAADFDGTQHPAHVTLCGPIYTTDVAAVVRTGQQLARRLKPLTLTYSHTRGSGFQPAIRWRSTISLRFRQTPQFFDATELCTALFANASYSTPTTVGEPQEEAHSTILYDYTGRSWDAYHALPVSHPEFFDNVSFTATNLSIAYTPLRDWFSSVADMRAVVGRWSVIRTFPLVP